MSNHRHEWTTKPSYPELGTFCMQCGKRKPVRLSANPVRAEGLREHIERTDHIAGPNGCTSCGWPWGRPYG